MHVIKLKIKAANPFIWKLKSSPSIFFDELIGKSTFLEFREGSQRPAEAASAAGGL